MFPAYYIFNSLLLMLLVLHVIWTYMILKIVVDSLQKGLVSVEPCGHQAVILLTVLFILTLTYLLFNCLRT